MKTKTKSALMIISTLILGIFIGSSGTLLYTKHTFKTKKRLFKKGGLAKKMMHIIKPTQEQRKILEPILESHEFAFHSHREHMRKQIFMHIDSLKHTLLPYLTEEQKIRLERFILRDKKRKRHHEKN